MNQQQINRLISVEGEIYPNERNTMMIGKILGRHSKPRDLFKERFDWQKNILPTTPFHMERAIVSWAMLVI